MSYLFIIGHLLGFKVFLRQKNDAQRQAGEGNDPAAVGSGT
jgi:hypothetical protein